MAYPVNDGAILEFVIEGRQSGQVTLSVLHYKLTGTLGIPDGDATLLSFLGEVNDLLDLVGQYAACCAGNFNITNVSAQWIYPTRFHRLDQTPVALAGTVLDDALPPNVSAAISKKSDFASHHSRGTLHMPGVPIGAVVEGIVQAAALTRYNLLGTFVKAKHVTDTLVPILFNRLNPAASEEVTLTDAMDTSRVNRRRTVGVGI